MAVEHDCIVSATGDLTVGYELVLPEIFTLSQSDYEALHQAWVKAVRLLPKNTVLHKQDWFIERAVTADGTANSWLSQKANEHFAGRPYLDQRCYLYLTKRSAERPPSTSLLSTLCRRSIVPAGLLNPEAVHVFVHQCDQAVRLLHDSGWIGVRRLTNKEMHSESSRAGVIERYAQLLTDDSQRLVQDISFAAGIRIGQTLAPLYSLADVADLPNRCGACVPYAPYSTDVSAFPIGLAAPLGLLLPCNHLYNQYIFLGDPAQTIKKLEAKRLRLQSLSAVSRENAAARDAAHDFLQEAVAGQRLPVKAHFNVLAFTGDHTKLKDLQTLVTSALARLDAVPKLERDGAAQIWWAGLPGNAGDFPMNDTFDTFAEQACCFLHLEGPYRSDPRESGIRFGDRLSGKPVYADLYDRPRANSLTANMGTLVVGSSGGGKSMTVNHMLRSLHDQGAHCVTVDIGGSYRGLCELLGGYYFTYEEQEPIRFNPFYLPPGERLDTEKKESLKALLVALWKQETDPYNRSEYVAVSNALTGYYRHLTAHPDVFPCFDTFYEYLGGEYADVLRSHQVKDRDFDLDNFLYVLRPYYRGGEFDFLLNASENLDLLHQSFIVIELDNIKDHPILFPVVTLVIMELFISKMRKLPGVRKVLTIDEAWKAIAKAGMAEFLRYAVKTIRKFNGVPIIITQEVEDVMSSPIIKEAIINNTDIKIFMDMRKFLHKFDRLQEALGLSDKAKQILLSVNKDQRELFIDIGGKELKVYRNELCSEEYYAYTTEGKERVQVLEYVGRYGSVQAGIEALITEKTKR